MKIYFDSQKNIDFDKLSTYKIYTNYYKMLYTEDGIFKITDNNIYKIHIIDYPITYLSISGINMLIDKTIIVNTNISTILLGSFNKNNCSVRELHLSVVVFLNRSNKYFFFLYKIVSLIEKKLSLIVL